MANDNGWGELLSSAARTVETASEDQTNHGARGGHFIIKVTALTAGASITPHIQGKNPVTGDYYDVLVGAAIVATGTTVLKVYPGGMHEPHNDVNRGEAADDVEKWLTRQLENSGRAR